MIALEQARQRLENLGLKQAVEVLDNTLDSAVFPTRAGYVKSRRVHSSGEVKEGADMTRPRTRRHDLRCPHCGSNWTPKDGHSQGRQTCRCQDCHYRFTLILQRRLQGGVSDLIWLRAARRLAWERLARWLRS